MFVQNIILNIISIIITLSQFIIELIKNYFKKYIPNIRGKSIDKSGLDSSIQGFVLASISQTL